MILIVGLGNPGKEYEDTHHNMGFMVLDEFAKSVDAKICKNKDKSLIFEGNIMGEKTILAKPQTYMNLSGEAVVALKNRFKPDKILVVYDDIDVEVGAIRFRNSGSAGSHNGMRSIVSLLGSQDFARVRIGIGPKPPFVPLVDYVLADVPKAERQAFFDAFSVASDEVIKLIDGVTTTGKTV